MIRVEPRCVVCCQWVACAEDSFGSNGPGGKTVTAQAVHVH